MKLTKTQLKKIIKEELGDIIKEDRSLEGYRQEAIDAATHALDVVSYPQDGLIENEIHLYLQETLGLAPTSEEIFNIADEALSVAEIMLSVGAEWRGEHKGIPHDDPLETAEREARRGPSGKMTPEEHDEYMALYKEGRATLQRRKNNTMKPTKRQLRKIIKEELTAQNQRAFSTKRNNTMKLTKRQLRKIIKEELSGVLKEGLSPDGWRWLEKNHPEEARKLKAQRQGGSFQGKAQEPKAKEVRRGNFESHKRRILQALQEVPFEGTPNLPYTDDDNVTPGTPSKEDVKKIQKLLDKYYDVAHYPSPSNRLIFSDAPNKVEIVYDYLDGRWIEN